MIAMSTAVTVSLAEARAVLDASLAYAEEHGFSVCVAVVDAGGCVRALARMDGATFLATGLAIDKAMTAAATGTPTADFADWLSATPVLAAAMAAQEHVALLPGGAPIALDGSLAGGVGVAGAPASQEQLIAAAGLAALGPTARTAPAS
jgi:glc operon protein GlcG